MSIIVSSFENGVRVGMSSATHFAHHDSHHVKSTYQVQCNKYLDKLLTVMEPSQAFLGC